MVPRKGDHPTREETVFQADITVKEFMYHMHPVLSVMKVANISG